MSELNVGIVGLGWVAGAHIEAFKLVDGATVSTSFSRRKQSEADLAAQYGLPLKPCNDYDEMLADPSIDIVDICTPHPFHAEQIIAAARAGKHVLIEKPICLSMEDANRIRATIRETGVKACVCFECRFIGFFKLPS